MKTRNTSIALIMIMLIVSCAGRSTHSEVGLGPRVSIRLIPRSATFDIYRVPQGAVSFTASIKNAGTRTVTIAHPSLCVPADYQQGEIRRFRDSHGKSEILLRITKPGGSQVVLRDGYIFQFDPGNVPLITIAPNGTGTFELGWFFPNARGRWERDAEAAKVFLSKGAYKVKILFRNTLPKAVIYNPETQESKFVEVWTGEMESAEVTIEVR